ncbi:MAG: hypothetical protein MSB80_02795 [Alphaproteobacteria bacterium]|nr:hypothetical protein [Alphaproteobacteria bacterium]
MKRQSAYNQGGNLRIVFYALGLVILAGVGFLMVHDIQVPTEHTTQEISINLEN